MVKGMRKLLTPERLMQQTFGVSYPARPRRRRAIEIATSDAEDGDLRIREIIRGTTGDNLGERVAYRTLPPWRLCDSCALKAIPVEDATVHLNYGVCKCTVNDDVDDCWMT